MSTWTSLPPEEGAEGAMLAHVAPYQAWMFSRSERSRPERELIATVVSSVNGCHY